MDFQEIIKLLFRKKFYLIIVPLISAMIAFALRFSSDRIYVSESQISTGLTLANDFANEKNNISPFQTALSFGNLIENMASKMVVNRLAYRVLYRELSSEKSFRKPDFKDSEVSMPKGDSLDLVLDELRESIDQFQMINRTEGIGTYIYDLLDEYEYSEHELLSNVNIYRVGNTDFINIRFSSEVPKLSAYIVNLWAENFLEYYNYQKTNRLNESLGVLTQILKEKQKMLDQNTEKLNNYRSRYLLRDNLSENDPIAEYERLIRDKESNVRSINFRLQSIREKIAETDKSSSFRSRQKIIGLKNDIDRLSSKQMDEPRNKALSDSLELLRNQLQSEMYLHANSSTEKNKLDDLFVQESELKVEYQIALTDLQKLRNQFEIEKGTRQNIAATKSVIENLETEVKQSRDEFISAQDKYNQTRSELLTGSSSIKLSYYGDIPEEPQSRKTIIFTGVGFVAGFLITLFMILALEFLDTRIKNYSKFKRETNLEANELIEKLEGLDIHNLDKILVGQVNQFSKDGKSDHFTQSIRKLRYELKNQGGGTVMFTSLRPQAGKSFLLSSLAYAMSLVDKKVLIVDTNFRNEGLSSLVKHNGKERQGYPAILANETLRKQLTKENESIDLIAAGIVTPSKNPYVHVMTSPVFPKSPEEVFSKVDFKALIKRFRVQYDYVFIEGASLNLFSDSRELSVYADFLVVLFSVEDEYTEADMESLHFIKECKQQLKLYVLNKLRKEDVVK